MFSEALEHLPELGHVVAIETRYVAEEALRHDDREVLVLAIRYFNTYLRGAINQRGRARLLQHLHQYRLLAEHMFAARATAIWCSRSAAASPTTGRLAHRSALGFVTETAAHDLAVLCERAFEHGSSCHDTLLGIFLEVDKEPETRAEEQTLRGVRKAQVKLATFYLARGAVEPRPAHRGRHARREARPAGLHPRRAARRLGSRSSGRSRIAASTSTTSTASARKSSTSSSPAFL